MNNISIIIPTLQKCTTVLILLLDTLVNDDAVGEIIVIDNSLKGIDYNNDKLRIILPKENLFVNPSWNLGVKEAKYDIIGLLNDDIEIPNDFCSSILKKFKPNMGILGADIQNVIPIDKIENNPVSNNIELKKVNYMNYCYGIAMFFHKNVYVEIPNEIKIGYGDNWIFDKAKKNGYKNYKISCQQIYHLGSLSSASSCLNPILKNDGKIYKRLSVKWYHRLLSFDESWEVYKLRLLGITFKIKKFKNKIKPQEFVYYSRNNNNKI